MTTKEKLNDAIEKIDAAARYADKTGQDLGAAKLLALLATKYAITLLPEYVEGYAVREAIEYRREEIEEKARNASAVSFLLCRTNDVLRHVATYYGN